MWCSAQGACGASVRDPASYRARCRGPGIRLRAGGWRSAPHGRRLELQPRAPPAQDKPGARCRVPQHHTQLTAYPYPPLASLAPPSSRVAQGARGQGRRGRRR
eukprot:scaffold1504_cov417-Prasinococcus_capsulatus_cf.AAC.75